MAIWGGVFEFDEQRFREVVVPAFYAGEHHPVISSTVDALVGYGWDDLLTGTDLAAALAYVGDQLSEWPLHEDELRAQGWDFEFICVVYEWVVMRETVRSYSRLGRTGRDLDALFGLRAGASRLEELVAALDPGPHAPPGFWMPGIDGSSITGWLDAARTRELAALLPRPFAPPNSLELDRQAVLFRAGAHVHRPDTAGGGSAVRGEQCLARDPGQRVSFVDELAHGFLATPA
ncbi:hypothetical protein NLX83_04105 [Allokutzneria sp. A3M-2-11 16]|uniref:hypothetical protein n=1 Tax=Allokutzneria sp. A3M-2-11 16 TaxID=2962043 RepID=UPI0020B721BA|nr:hypothetical protein [Allokutzneria sp. A3M-2-11 16]MCP3798437.1 hypothetical protein [Allokutzneria sp. A3M-2-11 16]